MTKKIESDGFTLHTESFGKITDPALVLIAGAGASAHFWTDSFCDDLVEAGYFVIRYDHRDIGLSSVGDFKNNPYAITDLANDVMAILDGYGIDKAHIVGHAMGGFIAQFLAVFYPGRILSITCISAGAAGLPKAPPERMSKAERDQMSKTWEVLMSNTPSDDEEESAEGFLKVWDYLMGEYDLDRERARAYLHDLYTRTNRKIGPHDEHMAVMQGMGKTVAERPELMEEIKCKTLVIHGELDYMVTADRGGKVLAEEIKGAQLKIIPKMGHMFFNRSLEKELSQIIIAFIK